jgi:amino acid transporter
MAIVIVLLFTAANFAGIRWVTRIAVPVASLSALLALLSAVVPLFAGKVDWTRALSFHLASPFPGTFGGLTSAMAGLYLIGFAAPAFEAAACHVGETVNPEVNVPRAMYASAGMASLYFVVLPVVWLGALGSGPLEGTLTSALGPTFAPLQSGSWSSTCSTARCSRSPAPRGRCRSSPRTDCSRRCSGAGCGGPTSHGSPRR